MVKQPYPSYSEHLWVSLLVLFSLSHDVRKSFYFIFLKQSQSEKNLNKSVSAGAPVETTLCACVFDTDTPCTDVMHFTSSCPHLHLQTSGRDRFHLKHLMFFTFYLRKKKVKVKGNSSSQKKKDIIIKSHWYQDYSYWTKIMRTMFFPNQAALPYTTQSHTLVLRDTAALLNIWRRGYSVLFINAAKTDQN